MKKRLARTCNIDGSDPHTFILPNPQIIAKTTVHPNGRATAELTDYGKEVLSQFSDDFWKRANAQFDDIREQQRKAMSQCKTCNKESKTLIQDECPDCIRANPEKEAQLRQYYARFDVDGPLPNHPTFFDWLIDAERSPVNE